MDDNEHVDFVNGLLAVTRGYNDHDVTEAVEGQLRDGVTFTLPHPIEMQVAEGVGAGVCSANGRRTGAPDSCEFRVGGDPHGLTATALRAIEMRRLDVMVDVAAGTSDPEKLGPARIARQMPQ